MKKQAFLLQIERPFVLNLMIPSLSLSHTQRKRERERERGKRRRRRRKERKGTEWDNGWYVGACQVLIKVSIYKKKKKATRQLVFNFVGSNLQYGHHMK